MQFPVRGTTVAGALFATAASAFALLIPASDPDLFWHLASGDWMLDHRELLTLDVFSFTRSGVGYRTGQWLGEVVLALVFRAGGWLGLELLRASLVGVAAFFASRATMRVQPHVGWAAIPVIATILVSRTIWADRPQLFTLALFPFVFDLLIAARLEGKGRRLALLPFLFLAWANLHGAFVAGLALVAVFVVEALLARPHELRGAMTLAFVGSALASFGNPDGPRALFAGLGYASTSGAYIVEEGPLDVIGGAGVVVAGLFLGSLAIAFVLGYEGIAARLSSPLLWAGLIVPFGLLGFAIQRQVTLACIVIAPFVAAGLPAVLGRRQVTALLVPRLGSCLFLTTCGIVLAVEAAALAPRAPDLTGYPVGAVDVLARTQGNVLNEYDWGGFLIRMAPAHPVFVDGRGAALYVPDVLGDFDEAVRLRPGYRAVLDRWRVDLVLVRPARPLAVALRDGGWRVLGEEIDKWVLLRRP